MTIYTKDKRRSQNVFDVLEQIEARRAKNRDGSSLLAIWTTELEGIIREHTQDLSLDELDLVSLVLMNLYNSILPEMEVEDWLNDLIVRLKGDC